MTPKTAPWWPHVYVMQCTVNEPMLDNIADVRGCDTFGDPEWLRDIRRGLSAYTEDIEELRCQPFVKIGSTYGTDPSMRTTGLGEGNAPKTTMMCRRVPVVGVSVICYIPAEEEVERRLHDRWAADRIDPQREFFWTNDEIADLALRYLGYDPNPELTEINRRLDEDPFASKRGRRRAASWSE